MCSLYRTCDLSTLAQGGGYFSAEKSSFLAPTPELTLRGRADETLIDGGTAVATIESAAQPRGDLSED